ncbi:hypothetical protein BW39_00539 [Delftia sp. RIT313]|nr:hypothetical protein BW39_00539 [Delftia sp. RIT313]
MSWTLSTVSEPVLTRTVPLKAVAWGGSFMTCKAPLAVSCCGWCDASPLYEAETS